MATKIISFVNHKGGVGKTTTTLNVGASLAKHHNKRVLLVDLDSQANLSQSLGYESVSGETIYEALQSNKLPTYNVEENLDITPSSIDLAVAEVELINEVAREYFIRDLVYSVKDKYDYILIDCPPSLGLLTLNALSASTDCIIVVQSEFLALKGMAKLLFTIDKIKAKLNKELNLLGVVMTQFDSRVNLNKVARETVEENFAEQLFRTSIRKNVALGEAPSQLKNIFDYDSTCNGAIDYKELTTEIINRTK